MVVSWGARQASLPKAEVPNIAILPIDDEAPINTSRRLPAQRAQLSVSRAVIPETTVRLVSGVRRRREMDDIR